MLLTGPALRKVGLLTEDYFLNFDEQTGAIERARPGMTSYYAPTSIISHKGAAWSLLRLAWRLVGASARADANAGERSIFAASPVVSTVRDRASDSRFLPGAVLVVAQRRCVI